MFLFRSSPEEWAGVHFGGVELGDRRLNGRLVRVAGLLARTPSGTLPGAMPTYADLKAAYRLLAHENATHGAILSSHYRQVREECSKEGEYLLIEDTTSLDFTFREIDDLGSIGNGFGTGFHVHTTLAVRYGEDAIEPLGIFAQQTWARTPDPSRARQSSAQRSKRARESERWAREIPAAPPGAKWVFVADRESDIYRCMKSLRERGLELVIRAAHNRKLESCNVHLLQAAKDAPVLGSYELKLRGRPQSPARTAKIELRSCPVRLLPPSWIKDGTPLCLNLVEANEVNPPKTGGVRWLLLTSLPVQDATQARAVVARYSRRWLIEEYHKCLKTGCGMEESQLASGQSLLALLGVLAVVAVRLLSMKFLAETRAEDEPPSDVLGEHGLKLLGVLRPQKKPKGKWTWRSLLVSLGCLGGFIGRKGDGLPGWQNLWRGQLRLQQSIEGAEALCELKNTCG